MQAFRYTDVMQSDGGEVTRYLERMSGGDERAADDLLPLVYDELRRIANQHMRSERSGHTLQPTALVHEAYLKLVGSSGGTPQIGSNRAHFFAIASRAVRQVLISHARARDAEKRGGGGAKRVPLDADAIATGSADSAIDALVLSEAIEELARLDARHARIAEMRLFGGLSVDEIAEAMGGSKRLIQVEWKAAKQWLSDRLK